MRRSADLVLRAMPDGAAVELAAEIGVVEPDAADESVGRVVRSHGVVDLLGAAATPSGSTDAEVELQRERRNPHLGLSDQVYRQEPGREPQLRVLHQATRGHRCLMPAAVVQEELARAVPDDVVLSCVAPGAAELLKAIARA